MDKGEILAFLRRQRYGCVSSVGPGGEPQAAVVGLAFGDDGAIVFDTLGSSRKARNLRRDGRAAIVVWEGERTVQIEGDVDEPTGDERDRARAVYFAAFPDGVDRLSWEGITHFRLRPTWLRYSAFDTGGDPLIVELAGGLAGYASR